MEPGLTRSERRARWWKGPRVGLGAILGAILLVAAACGGSDESATTQDATSTTTSVATTTTSVAIPTTVSSTTTTVAAVSAEDALAVVFSAIAALNRGDIDTYKTSLTGEELGFEVKVQIAEAFTYANATTELSDCRVTANTPRGSVVKCESTSSDDFYGAGGIVDSGSVTFLVTENLKISSSSSDEGDDIPWEETEMAMFNLAFHSWLMDAYPSVFDDIVVFPDELGNIPGLNFGGHQPAEMGIAVQYVGEFVAQSDVYPINS